MKKIIALFLSLLMLVPFCVPLCAQAAVTPERGGSVPVVLLAGDGNSIYDENGNKALTFDQALKRLIGQTDGSEEEGSGALKESAQNVLLSFAIGVATGNYDEYYEKLQNEIAELTDTLQMDENGEPRYGTDISAEDHATNQRRMTTPNQSDHYDIGDYHFWYDWRRDPLAVADELDEYIEAVCAMTGHEQVGLVGRCLGTNFVLAYLAKYGYKNRIKGIGFDGGMMRGHDAMSESISGKFKTDGDSINRYLIDMNYLYGMDFSEALQDVVDFLEHAEILDGVSAVTRATIYDQVVEGVSSALALSTLFTIPSYWSCVNARDYDDAMLYVFGEEGSEKREKYAGLIEKIENYNTQVRQKQDDMLRSFTENGGNIGLISKYGFQNTPICESRNLVSDDFVSVRNSSLGATTSMLYNTLSDDYIAQRVAEGKGKYISPDKKVDASTAMFPDSTWFTKGAQHSNWTDIENRILYTVTTADHQFTVEDFPYTQFIVYDNNTGVWQVMTADNAATEQWKAEVPKEEQPLVNRVFRFLQSFFKIIRRLVELVKEKLGK